ncbi:hypothetical protein FB451DRAFT_1560545 [Mycena latifolia]|nr:hypothetical protein FB451DRAFT_1560545 [Mycena latifolia]
MAALRCHPETRRYITFFPAHYTPAEARERRIACHLVTDSAPEFVGATGIHYIDEDFKTCEAGIIISPDTFCGGLATDALQRTNADNVRMCGWLEWAGAMLERTIRGGWPDGAGEHTDVHFYSILKHERAQSVKAKLKDRINRPRHARVA